MQGQFGITVKDTLGTAVSGPLLLSLSFCIPLVLRQCYPLVTLRRMKSLSLSGINEPLGLNSDININNSKI